MYFSFSHIEAEVQLQLQTVLVGAINVVMEISTRSSIHLSVYARSLSLLEGHLAYCPSTDF